MNTVLSSLLLFAVGWSLASSFLARRANFLNAFQHRQFSLKDGDCIDALQSTNNNLHDTVSSSQLIHGSKFIDSVSVRNWGVFDSAHVALSGSPSFIVITGETGSGKSVFISAIEYICGLSKKHQFGLSKKNADVTVTSKVSLSLGSSSSSLQNYDRVFDVNTRKSFCENNGQKVSVKTVTSSLSKVVRFWSSDSMKKLEADGFLQYIDQYLPPEDQEHLETVKQLYDDWIESYALLERYQNLEERMIDGNEFALITHFLEEIKLFESKVRSFMEEVEIMTEDFAADVGDEDDGNLSPMDKLVVSIRELREVEMVSLDDQAADGTLDLSLAWEILGDAEYVLKQLSKSLGATQLHSQTTPNDKAKAKSGEVSHTVDAYTLETLRGSVADFGENLLDLRKVFNDMGFLSAAMDGNIEVGYDSIQSALEFLSKAKENVRALAKAVPDYSAYLSTITVLKGEWDQLSRKHNVQPSGLQKLKQSWRRDLVSMTDLITLLPQQKQKEADAREAFVRSAVSLSYRRYYTAKVLADKVNELLPELEMADKVINIKLESAFDISSLIQSVQSEEMNEDILQHLTEEIVESIKPSGLLSQTGWDKASLVISTSSMQNHGVVMLGTYSSIHVSSKPAASKRKSKKNFSYDEGDELGVNNALSVASILSSGECARLALAFETICYDNNSKNSEEEAFLIFDEIDAHIGGEAAVAVAKLLKKQGKRRQILAVTHNPIIAAAADKHFVVENLKSDSIKDDVRSFQFNSKDENKGDKSYGNSGSLQSIQSFLTNFNSDDLFRKSSRISELSIRQEREKEISRMATGNLNTEAGINLAKALLDASYQ